MVITKVKRKIIVTIVKVAEFERFKRIEIKLPTNTRKVTGVLVTGSVL